MQQSQFSDRWQHLRPDIRGALVFTLFILFLETVYVLTGGLAIFFAKPIAVVIFLAQGALVARYAQMTGKYQTSDYPRLGVYSALWTALLSIAWWLFLFFIIGLLSAGMAFLALPLAILDKIGTIVFHGVFSAIGAWLYGRFGGKKLVLTMVLASVIGVILMLIIIGIALVVLAIIGISFFR